VEGRTGAGLRQAATTAPPELNQLLAASGHVRKRPLSSGSATVCSVRPSSRIAFAVSWLVFAGAVVMAWRKILAAPDGDITRLFIATVAGALGLALLGSWLQEHEGRR
jgi:hypothetical protein